MRLRAFPYGAEPAVSIRLVLWAETVALTVGVVTDAQAGNWLCLTSRSARPNFGDSPPIFARYNAKVRNAPP